MATQISDHQAYDWFSSGIVRRIKSQDATPALVAISLGILVIGSGSLLAGFYLRAAFQCYLVLRAKPDVILPLLISTILTRLDFGDFRSGYNAALASEHNISLLGFEQYANAIPFLLIPLRTGLAVATAKNGPRGLGWLFAAWLIGLVPVVFASFRDMGAGEGGWTIGLKEYCVVCSVLYGGAVLHAPISDTRIARRDLLLFLTFILLAANLRFFGSKLLFVVDPLAAAMSVWLITRYSPNHIAAGGLLFGLSLVFCRNSTLTVLSTWSLCIVFALCRCLLPRYTSLRYTKLAARLALAGSIIGVSYAIYLAAHEDTRVRGAVTTLQDRIRLKFLGDRAPLWNAAWTDITQDPRVVGKNNAGFKQPFDRKERMWKSGAHNTYLELVQRLGWVAGMVGAAIFLAGIFGAIRAAASPGVSAYTACIYLCAAAFMIMNGATGHWPVGTEVGYIPLMMAGAGLRHVSLLPRMTLGSHSHHVAHNVRAAALAG